jgi:hypothetical protein
MLGGPFEVAQLAILCTLLDTSDNCIEFKLKRFLKSSRRWIDQHNRCAIHHSAVESISINFDELSSTAVAH